MVPKESGMSLYIFCRDIVCEKRFEINFQTYLIVTLNLHNQNLSLLWTAQIISAAGDAVYQLALLWLLLDMTNSTILIGLVSMSAYLPALALSLYADVMFDKMNQLWLMILANAG